MHIKRNKKCYKSQLNLPTEPTKRTEYKLRDVISGKL